MDNLFVIKGKDKGRRFELFGDSILIGRGQGCPVRLSDIEISRRHVELRKTEKGWSVIDLDSSNGLYVNGVKTKESLLSIGDQFQIGKTLLAYSVSADYQTREELSPIVDFAHCLESEDQSRIIHSYKQDQARELFAPDYAETSRSEWFQKARAHLNLIYHTTLAVSQTLDIDLLLRRIMEMIFEWGRIDRGCILLYNQESDTFTPKVSWRRNGENKEPFVINQSIIDYVHRNKKEGILTNDANPGFLSHDLAGQGIQEAICVPMLGRYGLVGIIYVDIITRTEKEPVPTAEKEPVPMKPEPISPRCLDSVFIPPVTDSGSASLFTVKKTETDTFIKIKAAAPEPTPTQRAGIFTTLTPDHLKMMVAIGHQAALAVEDTQYYLAMLQSERLAAVGQTVAVLSHHIKNILQGIQGGSYLIERGLSAHDESMVGKGWGIVEKNQGKISNLILDMLTFSKERTPVFESRNINKVIHDVGELMEGRAADYHIQLRLDLDETIPKFYFDAEQIHRAITNLVTNAIDAVRSDPRYVQNEEENDNAVSDETNHKARPPFDVPSPLLEEDSGGRIEIITNFDAPAGVVNVIVDDNGPGIPKELRDELFRPFFSKNKSSGTGLGLAVTHKIIQEHKGMIQISESPSGGARFTVDIPFVDKKPEEDSD